MARCMARWRRDASRGGEMVARWWRGGGEIGDRTARWQAGGEVRALVSAAGLPQPSCRNANGATLSVISLMCVHVYIQRGRGERVRGVGPIGVESAEWSVEVARIHRRQLYNIHRRDIRETCIVLSPRVRRSASFNRLISCRLSEKGSSG